MRLILAFALALAGAAHAAGPVEAATQEVPTPEQVRAGFRSSEAALLDRHGDPVQSLRIDMTVRRLPWVELKDISPALPGAILQAEDQRFYQHLSLIHI